ncbi:ATP-binding protein [Clostridium cochlearium]|uniref:sensor histidine kinase n=1 Tax=Clostridium cochlearium TaxID=1494 RepID=UPI0017DF8A83|nr:ATP-binding protein [Clostridium cochlearium]NMA58357.1 cell wall metabolism sensor histidine kinase WalK [Clostridium cochlearium]
MMKSIKLRLLKNFMLIIVISILAFEVFLISFTKRYYYGNLEEMLTNQVKLSSDFYSRYFSNTTLEENIMDNVDVFWKQTNAQVQIINTQGRILLDSIGVSTDEPIKTTDFKNALDGDKGIWIGDVSYDKHRVMSVAYPIIVDNKIIGVLRYISSLKEIDKAIIKMSSFFFSIGLIVIFVVGILSIFLSDTIIKPIKKLTKVAEKMAGGDLEVRNEKEFDDEIGKLSDTLNYMAEEILKKDKLKNEFISSISHEIRTPLTSIKGWAITLNTDDLEDKELIRDGLNIIEEESERLSKMVEELLDFSKLISGKVTIKKEKSDLNKVIFYIEKYLRLRAKRENIDFVVEKNYDLPILYIDEDRMKQVFINILDNAFKFLKEEGEKKVLLSTKIEDENVIVLIEDNGYGISKEDLPKIKEKFYKGQNSKSQNGIGLSICDEIIKMHGGTLDIESEVNKGTKVYIKLPYSDERKMKNE